MPISLPDDLSPDVYPLAWLVGRWEGFGMLAYPNVPETSFVQELEVTHDGGPYLRATSTLWLASTREGMEIHRELTGADGVARLERGVQWATETQYWRPTGEVDRGADATTTGANDRLVPTTGLEVIVADPAGVAMLYLGEVTGPRINLATDAVLRSATGAEIAGATRMYGLVQGDLLWAWDLAAFGEELRPYASGRLTRLEGAPDGSADGTGGAGERA